MHKGADEDHTKHVLDYVADQGLQPMPLFGTERTVIAVIGDERSLNIDRLRSFSQVQKVMRVLQPFKLAARETKHENTVIKVNGIEIGSQEICIMAGPCAIESKEQIKMVARSVKHAGGKILRGGAFKPRTGPYSFEGLREKGLKMIREAADNNGLAVITEVMDIKNIKLVAKYSDIVQVGTRNMQNFDLLKALGKIRKPVLLKRGLSSTVTEFLLAAEYILLGGNHDVILCERGIRTFETETRNTLGLNSIPLIKELSHLPVVVDPSHATGKRSLINPMCKAAIAAGADGLLVEVHPNPEEALCDGDQSITPEMMHQLMTELKPVAEAVGRSLPLPTQKSSAPKSSTQKESSRKSATRKSIGKTTTAKKTTRKSARSPKKR